MHPESGEWIDPRSQCRPQGMGPGPPGVVKVPEVRCENGPMANPKSSGSCEVVIPSDPAAARQVQDEILRGLKAHRFDERDVFSVKLALEEALVNAIKHGNQ